MASRDETDWRTAADVLPPRIDDLAVPVKLDTLPPWHKPRKQLVRERQWLYFSRHLIQREKGRPGLPNLPVGDPEVRYLTLPGIDYLDVRQLADVCHELDCRLTSTGFQSGGGGNPDVARAQFREKSLIDAGHISVHSHTFPRRFEDIIQTNSQAYRDLRDRGPFHIVNIDACGSIAAPAADHENRLIDAIYKTVELQLQIMTGRWLLFVTADARPDSIAEETLTRLCNAIYANAEASKNFRRQAILLLGPEEEDIRLAAVKASKNAGEKFLHLFSLGLAKWLLDLARGKDWDMQTHHPYCYSTMRKGDKTPSMVCLAFEFIPPPPGLQDRFGVTRARPVPAVERKDTSVRAAEKIGDMSNADSEIESDGKLRTCMIEVLRKQLEEVGCYDARALGEIGA